MFEVPLNFVAPECRIPPELKDWDGLAIDSSIVTTWSEDILQSWILRTYYQLRVAGYAATLSFSPQPGMINFVPVREFGRRQKRADAFTVIPQGDAHESMLADFRIFQNGLQPATDTTAAIWHWPQAGILPRDAARGNRMEKLSYKGRLLNLDAEFRAEDFLAELTTRKIDFEMDVYAGAGGHHTWNDYRSVDAILAVRDLTLYDARKKPASKLVNCWFAEVPALLGPEPAFQELRQSELDYIEVRTPRDAIAAVNALRDRPELYRGMIENGRKRRLSFTEDALTMLWVDTIRGPITQAFARWASTSRLRRQLSSARDILRERSAKARDRVNVRTGPRLLDKTDDGAKTS